MSVGKGIFVDNLFLWYKFWFKDNVLVKKLYVEISSFLWYVKYVFKRLFFLNIRGNFIWNDLDILKCWLYNYIFINVWKIFY